MEEALPQPSAAPASEYSTTGNIDCVATSVYTHLGRVAVLAAAFFCVIGAHYVMKSAYGALTVKAVGARGIPAITLITTITTLGVTFLVLGSHWVQVRFSVLTAMLGGSAVLVLALFPLLWVHVGGFPSLVVLFLASSAALAVGVYSVWTLLTAVVARLNWLHMTLFGAGAQIGVVTSTSMTQLLLGVIPVHWLPTVAAAGYLLAALLVMLSASRFSCYGQTAGFHQWNAFRNGSPLGRDILAFARSPYLRLLALVILAQTIMGDAIQWRIYKATEATDDVQSAAAMLSQFYQYIGLACLATQVAVVPLAFRFLTPRYGILIQPLLGLVAAALLGFMGAPSAILVVVALYSSLDYTLNNCMRESLYGPLPIETKVYPRAVISMAFPRFGSMVASMLMLGCGSFGNGFWTIVLLLVGIAWLVPAWHAGQIYGRIRSEPIDQCEDSVDHLTRRRNVR
jgi:hypothetical protein